MTPSPVFLAHPSSLAHDTGPHPEQAERIVAIERELERRAWLGWRRLLSPPAERSQLTAVHPEAYVASIEAAAARGGGHLDLDTVISEGSFEAALHGAGGAVALVDLLLDGSAPTGFSAHRPPGHHATRTRAMGFCLFNSIAVAATHALEHRDVERVMIVDWDVHHGNGTNDIFHASDRVLFVSIHQWPLYPGTGSSRDVGSGAGEGYTVNLPVASGSGDAVFGSLVDHVVVPLADAFAPELLLVSAGYDAHREDPLASCAVSEGGFAAMTRSIRGAAEALGAPVGCVLEGGYALHALARSVAATMEALAGPGERWSGWSPRRVRSRPPPWRPGRGWRDGGRHSRCSDSQRSSPSSERQAASTLAAIRSVENCSARSRPGTRGSGSARCGASAFRQASMSNGPQYVPGTPASAWGAIPTGVASTGTSQASASSTASPNPSRSEGAITALTAFTHSGTADGSTLPSVSSGTSAASEAARS